MKKIYCFILLSFVIVPNNMAYSQEVPQDTAQCAQQVILPKNEGYENIIPVANVRQNSRKPLSVANPDYPAVTRMETKVFKTNYRNEDIYNRLNRLEQTQFGAVSPEMSLLDRVDRLSSKINGSDDSSTFISEETPSEEDNRSFSVTRTTAPPANIAMMERNILGRTYETDTLEDRLARMETNVFGAAQAGDSNQRVANLTAAASQSPVQSFNMGGFSTAQKSNSFFNDDFGNSFGNSSFASSDSGSSSFDNSPTQFGLGDILQYALPMVFNFLNKNNTNTYAYDRPYPNYPYYSNDPYNGYYYPPYPSQSYSYYGDPYLQRSLNMQNNFGSRVRILP